MFLGIHFTFYALPNLITILAILLFVFFLAKENKDSATTRTFIYVLLAMALWCWGEAMTQLQLEKAISNYFMGLASLGWILLPPLSLSFAYSIENNPERKKKYILGGAYLAAVIFIFLSISGNLLIRYDILKFDFYGRVIIFGPAFRYYLLFNLASYLTFFIILLGQYRRAIDRTHRRAIAYLISAAAIAFVLLFAVNGLLPIFAQTIMPVTAFALFLNATLTYIAFEKYNLFSLTPEAISSKIFETVGAFLLIVDKHGDIYRVNSALKTLIGQEKDDYYSKKSIFDLLLVNKKKLTAKDFFQQVEVIRKSKVLSIKTARGEKQATVNVKEIYTKNDFLIGYIFEFFNIEELLNVLENTNILKRGIDQRIFEKTKELENLKNNLEKQVAERTRELSERINETDKTREATVNILEDVEVARRETEKERNRLATVLAGIADGVLAVDANKKIILFNRAMEKLTGLHEAKVLGENSEQVMFVGTEKCQKREDCINLLNLHQCMLSKKEYLLPIDAVLFDKNDKKIPVSGASGCIVGEGGEVLGSILVLRDMTKEREIDKAKNEFLSVASHQLRTPLTGIKWFLEMILAGDAGPISAKQKKFLDQTYQSNERMIALVSDLLNVSRMEAGKTKVEPKAGQNMNTMMEAVITEVTPMAKLNKISILLNQEKIKLPPLWADIDKLRQAVSNLITNAVKYSKSGSQVIIKYKLEPNRLVCSIADQGVGIPAKQQSMVFEKFFRADNVISVQTEGSGLGLYISKSIIEGHGGKLWFESEEGQGTTFYFSLPLRQPAKKNDTK